jgi:hypothetical protein
MPDPASEAFERAFGLVSMLPVRKLGLLRQREPAVQNRRPTASNPVAAIRRERQIFRASIGDLKAQIARCDALLAISWALKTVATDWLRAPTPDQ